MQTLFTAFAAYVFPQSPAPSPYILGLSSYASLCRVLQLESAQTMAHSYFEKQLRAALEASSAAESRAQDALMRERQTHEQLSALMMEKDEMLEKVRWRWARSLYSTRARLVLLT